MKWNDYRVKLGIGFSDKGKARLLSNKISTFLRYSELNENYSRDDYYFFCLYTGIHFDDPYDVHEELVEVFEDKYISTSISELVSYYIGVVNSLHHTTQDHKQAMLQTLQDFLDELNIGYELVYDEDGAFVFPKGAAELDDALISEPLEWIENYPATRKTFLIALRQYYEGIYIRDVADNLRKALEAFFQEFLGNTKNLETNKNEIARYLSDQQVDAGIAGLFQPLINAYKNINDRIAKHNDAVDKKLLEFLVYQTGLLIRMVLVVKAAMPLDE